MTGEKIRFGLKNDYMFRAALQSNEKILRGLVSALLDLPMGEITECIIENPIILGETIDEKSCVMDVRILLNSKKRLNIELQTTNYGDWPDRSLLYLCRAFDQLPKGSKYSELKPTIHIGILDFTLFPEEPEFYAEYKLLNTKTHRIYNSKFALRVLDLTQLENVPKEQRESDLYYWAKLFLATSWEEVAMLAEKKEIIKEVETTIRRLSAEERIALQCEAQEKLEHDRASAYHCGELEGHARGLEEGHTKGLKEGKKIIITNLLKKGMPDEEICAVAECDQNLIDSIREKQI